MNHAWGCTSPGEEPRSRRGLYPGECYEGRVKVLCPQCERLIALEVFRVDGPVLIITCAKCGAESRVERVAAPEASAVASNTSSRPPSQPPRVSLASTEGGSNVVVLRTAGHEAVQKAAKAADEKPFTVPDGVCPRCIARRAETPSPSCPHCGILFESFDEASVLPQKWLREEWVEVLRDWSNELKHTQLRRKAQQADALAAVGRLYRLRQAFVPEDPVAEAGRADVLRMAAMGISFRPEPSREVGERGKKIALVGTLLVVLGFLSFVVVQLLRTN